MAHQQQLQQPQPQQQQQQQQQQQLPPGQRQGPPQSPLDLLQAMLNLVVRHPRIFPLCDTNVTMPWLNLLIVFSAAYAGR